MVRSCPGGGLYDLQALVATECVGRQGSSQASRLSAWMDGPLGHSHLMHDLHDTQQEALRRPGAPSGWVQPPLAPSALQPPCCCVGSTSMEQTEASRRPRRAQMTATQEH